MDRKKMSNEELRRRRMEMFSHGFSVVRAPRTGGPEDTPTGRQENARRVQAWLDGEKE